MVFKTSNLCFGRYAFNILADGNRRVKSAFQYC